MHILSAKWVVPVATPVIRDGSIVVAGYRIVDIGKRSDILKKYSGLEEVRHPCILMPGLINAHMHLELSHLKARIAKQEDQSFTNWIAELLAKRDDAFCTRADVVGAFTAALKEQYSSGVVLIADTGNQVFPELSEYQFAQCPELLRMVEYLGPNHRAIQDATRAIDSLPDRYPACVHAPYSTGADLLLKVKSRCRRLNHIYSVHTAETADEIEFIRSGTGSFREFLEKRKSWDGCFTFSENGYDGTIAYFEYLGVLDHRTLLVHAVHVSATELVLAAERGAHICLCPGSNLFLGVGKAPVAQMLTAGILPAIGTDSPASNSETDLWREMQLLAVEHPEVERQSILAMATTGGAEALHRDEDYGSLAPGKNAKILHVSSPVLTRLRESEQLIEELVNGGRPVDISWVADCHSL